MHSAMRTVAKVKLIETSSRCSVIWVKEQRALGRKSLFVEGLNMEMELEVI